MFAKTASVVLFLSLCIFATCDASRANWPCPPGTASRIPCKPSIQLFPCGGPEVDPAQAVTLKLSGKQVNIAFSIGGTCVNCNDKNGKCMLGAIPVVDSCPGFEWEINADSSSPSLVTLSPPGKAKIFRLRAYGLVPGSPVLVLGFGSNRSVNASRWIVDSKAKRLRLAADPSLCLDSGSLFSLDCHSPAIAKEIYCDPNATSTLRAKDLVSRMDLTEKVQVMTVLNRHSIGIPRLGVPYMQYGEALHGVCAHICGQSHKLDKGGLSTGCATSFPHALHTAASFNRSLFGHVGAVIGTEARSLSNQHTDSPLHAFAPNIQVAMDPRWGRIQETAGEDPLLASEYAVAMIRGMQEGITGPEEKDASMSAGLGRDRYLMVSYAKHYVDYTLEGCVGRSGCPNYPDRHSANVTVSPRDQADFFLHPWIAAVRLAKVGGLMCSYNMVNGLPMCGNSALTSRLLRGALNWTGVIISDGGAIGDGGFHEWADAHGIEPADQDLAIAKLALQGGGVDIGLGAHYQAHLVDAVDGDLVPEATVDQSVQRILAQWIDTGLMDRALNESRYHEYHSFGPAQVDTEDHRALSLQAAEQGMVLLKNDGGLLPLGKHMTLAVLGPHLNATQDMLSNYKGTNVLVDTNSPLDGLLQHGAKVLGTAFGCVAPAPGPAPTPTACLREMQSECPSSKYPQPKTCRSCCRQHKTSMPDCHPKDFSHFCNMSATPQPSPDLDCVSGAGIPAAVALARQADVALVFLGLTSNKDGFGAGASREGETWDRLALGLPGHQEQLLTEVAAANNNTIAVLIHGGPLSMAAGKAASRAILDATYPGQLGGSAIARTLFGDASPAGRLTTTVYGDDFVARRRMNDTDLRSVGGVTYRYYEHTPLWPFGWGLTYADIRLGVVPTLHSTTAALAAEFPAVGSRMQAVRFRVPLANHGDVDSDFVVLAFLVQRPRTGKSSRTLCGFERVHVAAGTSVTASVGLAAQALAAVDQHGAQTLVPGEYRFEVGGPEQHVEAQLELTGNQIVAFNLTRALEGPARQQSFDASSYSGLYAGALY